jgi:tetratricopeptide (TPR) repeat protein
MRQILRWGLVGLLLALIGCAQTSFRLGNEALQNENYYLAESYFLEALQENPENLQARRGLGLTYYHRQEYEQAAQELAAVRREMPGDGLTSLYLGLTHEQLDDFTAAASVYNAYLAAAPEAKITRQIRGRLLYIRNEESRRQVAEALAFDRPLIQDSGGDKIIGVLPFIPNGEDRQTLDPLAAGLAALLANDLLRLDDVRVVERMQLQYILEELALAADSLVDLSSAPRLNRLIGAGYLVRGDLVDLGEQEVAVHSGVINTAQGSYNAVLDSEEKYSRLWELQKKITFALVDSLGLELTPAERNAISRVPTESFTAFMAYCQGVAEQDAGNYAAAEDYFQQAVAADPTFEEAATRQEEADLLQESGGTAEEFEESVTANIIDATFDFGFDPDVTDNFDELTESGVGSNDKTAVEEVIEPTGTVVVGGSIR